MLISEPTKQPSVATMMPNEQNPDKKIINE
jgi:hypothetical protein